MGERLRREAGLITTRERGSDRIVSEVMTVQCCHCGGHIRSDQMQFAGFCTNCNAFHCGDSCEMCLPAEQFYENIEAGRDPAFKPTRVGPRSFGGTNFSPIFTGE